MTSSTHPYDVRFDLEDVLPIHEGAWSPRKDVYAAVAGYAWEHDHVVPSTQVVYQALRARGFREAKINGHIGFRDIAIGPGARVTRRRRPNAAHGARSVNRTPWAIPAHSLPDDLDPELDGDD